VRLLTLLVLCGLLAAGCASSEEAAPDSIGFADDPVTLTVWGWDGVFPDGVVELFEQENPDIRIEVRTSDFDQHHTGLQDAIALEGSLPDVAALERTYLPEFLAHADRFVDLREFGAGDLEGDYLDWRWAEGVAATNEVIGLPTDVGGLALAYRKDLFAEAGLPSEPDEVAPLLSNWDSFIAFGQRYVDSGVGAYFIDGSDSLYRVRLAQEEFTYVDTDGNPTIDDTVASAWNFALDVSDRNLAANLPQFSPEWNAGFADRSFAAIAAPSWMRGYIQNIAPETDGLWSIVPVPEVGGNWGGSQLTVPADTPHPEEAWRFVRYMTSVETQLELFRQNGNFPSTPELYEYPEVVELDDPFFDGQNVGRIYVDSVEALSPQPSTPRERDLEQVFMERLWIATYEREEADDFWEEARAEGLAIIEAASTD